MKKMIHYDQEEWNVLTVWSLRPSPVSKYIGCFFFFGAFLERFMSHFDVLKGLCSNIAKSIVIKEKEGKLYLDDYLSILMKYNKNENIGAFRSLSRLFHGYLVHKQKVHHQQNFSCIKKTMFCSTPRGLKTFHHLHPPNIEIMSSTKPSSLCIDSM